MSTYFELEEGECYSLNGEVLGEFKGLIHSPCEDGSCMDTYLQFTKNRSTTLFDRYDIHSRFIKISCSLVPGYSSSAAATTAARAAPTSSSSSSARARTPETGPDANLEEAIRRSLLNIERGSGVGSSSSSASSAPAPASSASASASASNLPIHIRTRFEESITCPVCMELFGGPREPVTIPCGHTLCRSCLGASLRIKPECPICRAPTSGSADSYGRAVVVSNLAGLLHKP